VFYLSFYVHSYFKLFEIFNIYIISVLLCKVFRLFRLFQVLRGFQAFSGFQAYIWSSELIWTIWSSETLANHLKFERPNCLNSFGSLNPPYSDFWIVSGVWIPRTLISELFRESESPVLWFLKELILLAIWNTVVAWALRLLKPYLPYKPSSPANLSKPSQSSNAQFFVICMFLI